MKVQVPRLRVSVYDIANCTLSLVLIFLVMKTKAVALLSGLIANSLAYASALILPWFGFEVQQTAAELRDPHSGFALSVTQACDGLGIFVTLTAAVLTIKQLRLSWLQTPVLLVGAFLALQLFNLLRVIILYAALPASSASFETLHLYIFPLASTVAVGLLGMSFDVRLRPQNWKEIAKWSAFAVALAIVWNFVSGPSSLASVAQLSQIWLNFLLSGLTIVGEGKDALLQSSPPISLEFYPSDFTLGLPLVLASVLLAGLSSPRIWIALAIVLVSMSLAMALAALDTKWGAASERDLVAHSLAAALQDALVYGNLLLVPWLLLLINQVPDGHSQKLEALPSRLTKRTKKAVNVRK